MSCAQFLHGRTRERIRLETYPKRGGDGEVRRRLAEQGGCGPVTTAGFEVFEARLLPSPTKAEAQAAGRVMARRRQTEHKIQNKEGRITERNSYGNEHTDRNGQPDATLVWRRYGHLYSGSTKQAAAALGGYMTAERQRVRDLGGIQRSG